MDYPCSPHCKSNIFPLHKSREMTQTEPLPPLAKPQKLWGLVRLVSHNLAKNSTSWTVLPCGRWYSITLRPKICLYTQVI